MYALVCDLFTGILGPEKISCRKLHWKDNSSYLGPSFNFFLKERAKKSESEKEKIN